jgi:hypothetical protein
VRTDVGGFLNSAVGQATGRVVGAAESERMREEELMQLEGVFRFAARGICLFLSRWIGPLGVIGYRWSVCPGPIPDLSSLPVSSTSPELVASIIQSRGNVEPGYAGPGAYSFGNLMKHYRALKNHPMCLWGASGLQQGIWTLATQYVFQDILCPALFGIGVDENSTEFDMGLSLYAEHGWKGGACALLSSVFASTITHTLQRAKIVIRAQPMQRDGSFRFRSYLECMEFLWEREGSAMLWRGLGSHILFSLLCDGLYMVADRVKPSVVLRKFRIPFFEEVKIKPKQSSSDSLASSLGGGVSVRTWVTAIRHAALVAADGLWYSALVIVFALPLATMMRRMELQRWPFPQVARYNGWWHCFVSILKNEGISGFYKSVMADAFEDVLPAVAEFVAMLCLDALFGLPKKWTEISEDEDDLFYDDDEDY